MGVKREYVVGRYWLARRPESPFWQIVWYDEEGRTTRHRSTRCERLDDAKAEIHRYETEERAKRKQDSAEAEVVPLLMGAWREKGSKAISSLQVASSLRLFIAFLKQDRVTIGVTVQRLTPDVFHRFIAWRSGPHSYEMKWGGKDFSHASPGVRGETIQRNLEDVKAALNHHVRFGRLLFSPKVPSVDSATRSPPRDVTLTYAQLGAIVGYALPDLPALRWLLGQIATAARPDAVLRWQPAKQMKGPALFDTHPHGSPLTKKRNATVPVIDGFAPWLAAWAEYPHAPVKSRKTWWRTMRAAIGLPAEIVPKVIRHTIATELRAAGVSQSDVEGLLGHQMSNRITAVYAKYDPARLSTAKQALEVIWGRVWCEALKWVADHLRTTDAKGNAIVIARASAEC